MASLAAAQLGLVEPTSVDRFDGPILRSDFWGDYYEERTSTTARLTCGCGRSEPLLLTLRDRARITELQPIRACPLCVQEFKDAKSRSAQVTAWLTRTRAQQKNHHIYFPFEATRLVKGSKILRPRRLVYEVYYKVDLSTSDRVVCSCGDSECMNPLHLGLVKNPAQKLTPHIKEEIKQWLTKKMKTSVVTQVVKQKYGISITQRTVQRLNRELQPLSTTLS
jgi:hypothetical protein